MRLGKKHHLTATDAYELEGFSMDRFTKWLGNIRRTDEVPDAVLLCGTAVNIAMCLGSLGVSAPGGVVTQLGLTIIYRNEKEAALKDYDICTRNCELSYKK